LLEPLLTLSIIRGYNCTRVDNLWQLARKKSGVKFQRALYWYFNRST